MGWKEPPSRAALAWLQRGSASCFVLAAEIPGTVPTLSMHHAEDTWPDCPRVRGGAASWTLLMPTADLSLDRNACQLMGTQISGRRIDNTLFSPSAPVEVQPGRPDFHSPSI